MDEDLLRRVDVGPVRQFVVLDGVDPGTARLVGVVGGALHDLLGYPAGVGSPVGGEMLGVASETDLVRELRAKDLPGVSTLQPVVGTLDLASAYTAFAGAYLVLNQRKRSAAIFVDLNDKPVSILKPLKGIDDRLESNLQRERPPRLFHGLRPGSMGRFTTGTSAKR